MSGASYCDGCGKIFPANKLTGITIEGMFDEAQYKDYCDECFDEFKSFVDREIKGGK